MPSGRGAPAATPRSERRGACRSRAACPSRPRREPYHDARSVRRCSCVLAGKFANLTARFNNPKEVIPCLVRFLGFQSVVSGPAKGEALSNANLFWVENPVSRRAAVSGPLCFGGLLNRPVRRLTEPLPAGQAC